jgi:hypothetical protein
MQFIEIEGIVLKKLMWLTGLSMTDLSKKIDSNRTSLDSYVNSNRVPEEILTKIEGLAGIKLNKLSIFLKNPDIMQTDDSVKNTYWKSKYNELLKENEKLYNDSEFFKERLAEQASLIKSLEGKKIKKGQ